MLIKENAKIENALEKYLVWGKKIDFSSFEDYINRNLVSGFIIKERYELEEVKNIVKDNILQGIDHYAKENGLFYPFFEQLFVYNKDLMALYLAGTYKDVPIHFELGKVYLNLKKNTVLKRKKMLNYPQFKMVKYEHKKIILLSDFLKWAINESLENKALQVDLNIQMLEKLREKYINDKNNFRGLKIS